MFTSLRDNPYLHQEFWAIVDNDLYGPPKLLKIPFLVLMVMITFPIQVIAKSRTYEDHLQYYRWVRAVNGEIPFKPAMLSPHRPCILWVMDRCPKMLWRYMPLSWRIYHLFAEDN